MKPTRSNRPTLRQWVSGCSLSAMLFAQNASAFTIAQNPPFLPTPLPPNIVMTFDDSGSMRWAFNPESICNIELDVGTRGARRTKSAAFNALYYNPAVTYDAPLMYSASTGNYTAYTTGFTAARINGFNSSSGTVDLSSDYRVTWAFNPLTTSIGTPSYSIQCGNITPDNMFARNNATDFPTKETSGVAAYYYVYDPSGTGCASAATTNDACYRRVVVGSTSGPNGTDERENFANWYSFYRTRNLMTSSAATRALVGVPPTARVGWQALNTCNSTDSASPGQLFNSTCTGWGSTSADKRLKVFDNNHRQNMYRWLARIPANSGTPLRTAAARVGEYFRTRGVNSPYALNPTVSQGTEHSCRPNFHILMTDGLWNDNTGNFCSGSSCGNRDSTSNWLPGGKLPDGTSYSTTSSMTRIYRDSSSDTIADIAFHYWATDLRPETSMPNSLLPYRADRDGTADQQYWNPKNDPATWQHLVTFTVGLGLTKTLTVSGLEWGGSTYAAPGYTNLLNGTNGATWPAAAANNTPGNVYDLWHAAINSRGQSFSADTPRDLSDALLKALNRILERESAAAALATNSSRLTKDGLLFQARFFSGTWSGDLTAYAIGDDGALGAVQWEATAAGKIPAHGSRKVYTWNGISGTGTTFTQSGLNSAGLWSSIDSTALLDYLRGDTTNENPNGLRYRARSGPLGDIINSDPAMVGAENYGYSWIGSEGASYPAFLTAKKSRTKMLYVGGNDGFLRGFNALTGEEVFAYVPNAVVPDLPLLAATDYSHRFYVDGAPAAWDAYFGDVWKTVLTATTGAGGRSVFALDVTSPSSFDASKVLWEINQNTAYRSSGSSTDAADPQYAARLGYTLGQAVVVKLNNGEWAAVFGNGYRSPGDPAASPPISGDQASLYIVRVADGTLIKRIDTGVGSSGAPNGLGTPTLFDANGDDVADAVYAPDMRGNVWKFDLSGSNETGWQIPFGTATGFPNGQPLFQARSSSNAVQPISARIELAKPPPGKTGIMVLFGTGRFFAVGDNTDTTGQTFYGIWDNGSPVTATNRSTLQVQSISTESIDLRGNATTVRNVSGNPVDWATKRGWYIDLPTSMERVIGSAAVRDNRVIFTTLVPSTDPCEFGGTGWLMEVSAFTGAKLPYSVFDTNGDKLVTIADKDISGVPIGVGMVKRPLVIDGSPVAAKFLSGTKGEIQLERNRTFGPPLGRESWREVQR